MKTAGIILLVLGLVAAVIFGIQFMQQSDQVKILGLKIAETQGNWVPLAVSGVVALIGLVMTTSAKSSNA